MSRLIYVYDSCSSYLAKRNIVQLWSYVQSATVFTAGVQAHAHHNVQTIWTASHLVVREKKRENMS